MQTKRRWDDHIYPEDALSVIQHIEQFLDFDVLNQYHLNALHIPPISKEEEESLLKTIQKKGGSNSVTRKKYLKAIRRLEKQTSLDV